MVRTMTQALRHRGPDGYGEYISPHLRAAFGHRRLAIIDLVSGDQPMFNEDRTIAVVLNGEIYNFAALRAQLERHGHRFATSSDTEVIAHLYEERGVDCLRELRGMFAILLWDERAGRFLAARDPIGKKPLYYAEHGGRLSLASEITALYELPDLPRVLDPSAIDLYLTHSYIPSPYTVLAGVKKLPAGHAMVIERGRMDIHRYWRLPPANGHHVSPPQLSESLEEAVRLRMVADVPVGCFLSGGIDSSIVAALMARISPRPVKTFSIGFDRADFTELPYARKVARLLRTDHAEFVVKPDAVSILPELVRHYGEPFGDSSALPVWYLARLARQHVTVALNGDGGDELFGGYPWYGTATRLAALSRRVPPIVRRSIRHRGVRGWLGVLPRKVAKGLDLASRDDAARFAALRRTLDESAREAMYSARFAARVDGIAAGYLEQAYCTADPADLLRAMATTDITTYLPEDLLVKVDRATMAHALEARSPFLDTNVVQLALALPAAWKHDGTTGKRILRTLFGPLFPAGFFDRPKMGFSLPVDAWLRNELRPLLRQRLLQGPLATAEIVKPAAVQRLIHEHDHGCSRGAVLWNLLMLAEWFERFGSGAQWT